MAARQAMEPPFGPGVVYKIFNTYNPAYGQLATYVGIDQITGDHRFQLADGNFINIWTNNPQYGTNGLFVGYKGNAGGRRKSRRSKRSKRSHRKSKRRHH
jgi:hypothetical protein